MLEVRIPNEVPGGLASHYSQVQSYLRKTDALKVILGNMSVDSNVEQFCLVSLVVLDIFRGMRTYLFPGNEIIKKELNHLLDQNQFPAHYPKFLETAPSYSEEGCLNPAFLDLNSI